MARCACNLFDILSDTSGADAGFRVVVGGGGGGGGGKGQRVGKGWVRERAWPLLLQLGGMGERCKPPPPPPPLGSGLKPQKLCKFRV